MELLQLENYNESKTGLENTKLMIFFSLLTSKATIQKEKHA